jgi:hypothetical protein
VIISTTPTQKNVFCGENFHDSTQKIIWKEIPTKTTQMICFCVANIHENRTKIKTHKKKVFDEISMKNVLFEKKHFLIFCSIFVKTNNNNKLHGLGFAPNDLSP